MSNRLHTIWLLALIAFVAGCHAGANRDASSSSSRAVVALSESGGATNTLDGPHDPRDPPPSPHIVFKLEVYQLKVPVGSVSRNDALWKRINEQCIDVATYDLLYKNGIRAGTAPWEEWPFVREVIGQNVGTAAKLATIGDQMENIPLEMKKDVPFQTIFCFDETNTPVGKTFPRSENVINLSFQKVPRRPGHVRLALAPLVRAERKRLEYTVLNDALEFTLKQPETYYMNLIVDVPVGSFLIVSPSPEASWPSTVGHAFLINDAAAEQFETVLVIAAQPLIDEPSHK
jgi:hypothetical protein